jgi:hypothetical protein
MGTQNIGIEAGRVGDPGELVHPIGGLWRKDAAPALSATVEQIYVPRRAGRAEHALIGVSQPAPRVPIVFRAPVGDQAHAGRRVMPVRAELRNPNEIGLKQSARLVRQNRVLNFERPPKTEPSSRADEANDSHRTVVSVESRAKRLSAGFNVGQRRG